MCDDLDMMEIILKVSNVMYIALDRDGNVTLANDNAADVLGYSIDEIVGKNWFDNFIPERMRDEIQSVSKQILNGDLEPVKNYETPVLCKNGSERLILWQTTHMYDDEGNISGHISSGMDITEKNKAEEALKKSEFRFRQVVENALEWIWEIDKEGNYTYVSPVVEDIYGYKPEELMGTPFWKLSSPDVREHLKENAFENIMANKISFRKSIVKCQHKNGHSVWVMSSGSPLLDENGELLGYRGSDIDITEFHNTEEAFKESELKYRSIFYQAKEGIVLINPDNGMIVDANPEFEKQTGRSLSILRTMHIWEIRPPDQIEKGMMELEKLMTSSHESDMTVSETEFQRPDGTTVPIEFHQQIVNIHGNEYVQSITRDITERKIAERAIIEKQVVESKYALTKIMTDIVPALMTYGPQVKAEKTEFMREIMKRTDDAFFDRYFPVEIDTPEEFGRNICFLFNDMGGQYDYMIKDGELILETEVCPWKNEEAKNPILCIMTRGILERFGSKTLGNLTVEHEKSMTQGDRSCTFRIKLIQG